jgi:thiol-disulfide isomerase/thioredoxin
MTKISTLLLTVFMLAVPALEADYETKQPVDFTLQRLHGGELKLSELRGKWVVLNYWATWCAPCRKEIPELSALNETRDDIIVLGLAFEDIDIENFVEFLEKFHPSYPMFLVDVYSPPAPFGAPKVLPTTIILDPDGYPVKTFLGPVTSEFIESFIDD